MSGMLPILVIVGLFVFIMITTVLRRYKRCPSDRVLVVYGKVGGGSARCIHGGAAFIWPIFVAAFICCVVAPNPAL